MFRKVYYSTLIVNIQNRDWTAASRPARLVLRNDCLVAIGKQQALHNIRNNRRAA
jgi:hypothetical protein